MYSKNCNYQCKWVSFMTCCHCIAKIRLSLREGFRITSRLTKQVLLGIQETSSWKGEDQRNTSIHSNTWMDTSTGDDDKNYFFEGKGINSTLLVFFSNRNLNIGLHVASIHRSVSLHLQCHWRQSSKRVHCSSSNSRVIVVFLRLDIAFSLECIISVLSSVSSASIYFLQTVLRGSIRDHDPMILSLHLELCARSRVFRGQKFRPTELEEAVPTQVFPLNRSLFAQSLCCLFQPNKTRLSIESKGKEYRLRF